MFLDFAVHKPIARAGIVATVLLACALASRIVVCDFIVAAMTDDRGGGDRDELQATASQFPNSARLNQRVAEAAFSDPAAYEIGTAGTAVDNPGLAYARQHAQRAVELSPYNHSGWLILASINEALGDRSEAEHDLATAKELAPNNADVNWRYANLLFRAGKIEESAPAFRVAVASNHSLLPAMLEMFWPMRDEGGSPASNPARPADQAARMLAHAKAVAGSGPEAQMEVALFLARRADFQDAADVFRGIDPQARRGSSDTPLFFKALENQGQPGLERSLWAEMITAQPADGDAGHRAAAADNNPKIYPTIWNGSFESDILTDAGPFCWSIGRTDYAKFSVDAGMSRSGSRSLRVDFAGRDTTRLDGELKQMIVVRRGGHYRLECYVRAEALVSSDGPRIAVTADSGAVATSDPIASGSYEWRLITFDFIAPQTNPAQSAGALRLQGSKDDSGEVAVWVSLVRKPKYSYDDPMRGRLWLDDFSVTEVGGRRLDVREIVAKSHSPETHGKLSCFRTLQGVSGSRNRLFFRRFDADN